jgi:multidrug resistance efflux pump
MPDNKLDLTEVVNNPSFKFSVMTNEDASERETRLRIAEADAVHQRQKELLLYRLTFAVIVTVVILCSWIVLRKGLSTDDGKLALALLTSIVTGLVGYVTGKSAKS